MNRASAFEYAAAEILATAKRDAPRAIKINSMRQVGPVANCETRFVIEFDASGADAALRRARSQLLALQRALRTPRVCRGDRVGRRRRRS